MRAVRYERYGGPERLHLVELPTPQPGSGEVLVRVRAASLNSWDWDLLRGRPLIARIGGLFRPRLPVLGADVAGEVVAVGDGVTDFRVGDRVHGDLSGARWGGFAEFVAAPATALRRIPDGIGFVDAAALPQAGGLALQGLRLARVGCGRPRARQRRGRGSGHARRAARPTRRRRGDRGRPRRQARPADRARRDPGDRPRRSGIRAAPRRRLRRDHRARRAPPPPGLPADARAAGALRHHRRTDGRDLRHVRVRRRHGSRRPQLRGARRARERGPRGARRDRSRRGRCIR